MRISDESIFILIKFYKLNPCLWKMDFKDYRDRRKRKYLQEKLALLINTPGK